MLLDDLRSYLIAGGVSWGVYEGYLPDSPEQCIGLFETGGVPDRARNLAETLEACVTFQLRVRAGVLDYATGRAMWKTCFDLLQDAQESAGSPSLLPGVVYVKAMHYGPLPFNDEKGRSNFVSNFRVLRIRD